VADFCSKPQRRIPDGVADRLTNSLLAVQLPCKLKFPVSIHRDFSCKPLIPRDESGLKFVKSPRNEEIPCIFPCQQGIGRDWFAADCPLRQLVGRRSTAAQASRNAESIHSRPQRYRFDHE
jgi:hypothetical protein